MQTIIDKALKNTFKFSLIATLSLAALEAKPSIKHYDKSNQAVFEFLADDMEYNKEEVIGKGYATVINADYYVTANKAIYNTKTSEITLIGNVNAYKGNSLFLKAENVKIKLKEDYSFLKPFYLQDSQSGLWISAEEAQLDDNVYKIDESSISTCSVNNPIWKLKVAQGEYDVNNEWLSVWHPRFCIYDMPVMYFPYLSFSLGYKRKSGLLYPIVGNSRDDGFIYSQPIFIAPKDNWDMTFSPQIRTQRGGGFFNEFRMIDKKDEILWANFGVFGDSKSYQNEYDLENRQHFGFQLEYQTKNLFIEPKKESYFKEDGLYANISQINDIDYFRLQEDERVQNRADLQGSLLTSRLNYFLKSDQDYIGVYGRYYTDLELTSNANTMQTLPHVQYHRQMESIFLDNLYYSVDYQIKNHTRPSGYRAVQQEISLPLTYSQPLIEDYLNLSVSPIVYASSVQYSNIDRGLNLENGTYLNHYYDFKLNSDLMKNYGDFSHTLSLESEFILPAAKHKKGDFTSFFELPGDRKQVKFGAKQYFYNAQNDLVLSHKIRQHIYMDDTKDKYGEIENEIQYFYDYRWDFLSSIYYSHQKNRISEATHQVNYNDELINVFFGHYFREEFAHQDLYRGRFGEASYINAGFSKEFDYFNIYAKIGYDYKENYFKTWQVGVDTSIRCFSFGVKYVSEIYPTLTTRGAEAKDEKYVLFEIKFIPLLSSDLKVGN